MALLTILMAVFGLITFFVISFAASKLSFTSLFSLYLVFGIYVGLLRRVGTWLGIESADALVMALGAVLFVAFTSKFFDKRNKIRGKISIIFLFTIPIIFLGAIFPINQGVIRSLISVTVFLPVLLFLVYGSIYFDDCSISQLVSFIRINSIIVSTYTIIQSSFGFPPWDQLWIQQSLIRGFNALSVNGETRTFGVLSSPAECASFLSLGVITFIIHDFRQRKKMLAYVGAFYCLYALVTTGVRTSLVLLVIAMIIYSMGQLVRTRFFAILCFSVFSSYIISQLFSYDLWLNRIIEAFKNPFGSESIQARQITFESILLGLHGNPLGSGLAVLVNASARVSGRTLQSSDFLVADGILALGFLGILLSLGLILKACSVLIRNRFDHPNTLSVIPFLQINYLLNPNHYMMTALSWFALGLATRKPYNPSTNKYEDRRN